MEGNYLKLANILLSILFILLLTACSDPIPPEKSEYVGEWEGETMVLIITQDGRVNYERNQNSKRVSIDSPIKSFDGNNFIVGVGSMTTTFVVSKPPHFDGENWKMTVDGEEVIKQ